MAIRRREKILISSEEGERGLSSDCGDNWADVAVTPGVDSLLLMESREPK